MVLLEYVERSSMFSSRVNRHRQGWTGPKEKFSVQTYSARCIILSEALLNIFVCGLPKMFWRQLYAKSY